MGEWIKKGDDGMTKKRFTRKDYAIYEEGNPICMTLLDVDKRLNELWEENKKLKSEIKDLNDVLARYEEKELKMND